MLRAEVFVVAPEAPSGLAATNASGADPALAWTDNSKSALSFSLERSTTASFDPGTVVTLSIPAPGVGPGQVAFTDTTATMGRTYFYRVRAEKVLTTPAIPGVTYPAYSAFSAPLQVQTALQIAPQPLDFGNLHVNTSKTLQLTVTNPSSAPFTVTGVSITGTNAADFSQTNNCATVAGNSTCTISVTFTPGAMGGRSASLVVSNTYSQQSVSLSGTGTVAVGSVAPTSLTFPALLVNVKSATQSVVVSNSGNETLLLTTISFSGANRTDFQQWNSCAGSVAPGGTCTINVFAQPTGSGACTATMVIGTNDPAHPTLSVSLSGTAYTTMVPATGVTLSASTPSPAVVGTAVTFTAQGQGSPFLYQYEFWFYNGSAWSIVQPYGSSNTWTLPATTPAGNNYQVSVWVRTSSTVSRDAIGSMNYAIRLLPATGATLTANPSSPQNAGTAVTFTAQGTGSTGGYDYQFWFFNGTAWTMVQNYGNGNAWTMPAATPAGSYQVAVWVRTSPYVAKDVLQGVTYTLK
jgi:hypothetical protein